MMGIGNLTELTEVDSAGINLLLAGFCQELAIRSVLTTQVINWCRSAVREFDLARRLAYHAIHNQALPKHVDSRLVMLRDAKLRDLSSEELDELAAGIKDPNFRIFAERGELHAINRDGHRHGDRSFRAVRATRARGSRARILSGLRNGESRHGPHAGQELPAGRTAAMGISDPARSQRPASPGRRASDG